MSNLEWQAVGEPSAETKAKELELIRLVSDDESYKAARRETYERNKGKMKPILGNERLHIGEIIEYCKKKVAQLERFNKFEILGGSEISRHLTREYWGHRQVAEYLEELKQYRNLEEQGLILRLPCKVGDMVWEIVDECEGDNTGCYGTCNACHNKWLGIKETKFTIDMIDEVGNWFFLTQSEAEEKLRELSKEREEE